MYSGYINNLFDLRILQEEKKCMIGIKGHMQKKKKATSIESLLKAGEWAGRLSCVLCTVTVNSMYF